MKIIYIDEEEHQIGLSAPYHGEGEIRVGREILHDERLYTIEKVEIYDHFIEVTLKPKIQSRLEKIRANTGEILSKFHNIEDRYFTSVLFHQTVQMMARGMSPYEAIERLIDVAEDTQKALAQHITRSNDCNTL